MIKVLLVLLLRLNRLLKRTIEFIVNGSVMENLPDTGKAILKNVNEETDKKIEIAKSNYYKDLENKLSNSKNDNVFWSVVNRLVGKNKKMTNIPLCLNMIHL